MIKDNVPLNAEAPPHTHTAAITLGTSLDLHLKQDSRKSATVHVTLTWVGLFLIKKLKA